MKPAEVIAQLEVTSGRLEKEQILRDAWAAGCVEFFQGAKLAYDALVVFNINKAPLFEDTVDPEGFAATMTWDKFRELLSKLQRREITGNLARDTIRAASDTASAADWNGWYRRILLKDLKCGVTEATINKILLEIGGSALDYLPSLGQLRHTQEPIITAQDKYCLQQRKNEHTLRAIKNLLGDELAEEFVTTVLFPTHDGEH